MMKFVPRGSFTHAAPLSRCFMLRQNISVILLAVFIGNEKELQLIHQQKVQ
jgi:hypothetical protein